MKQIILIALISIIFSCKSNKTSLDQNSISKRKISLKDIKEKKAIIKPNNNNYSIAGNFLYHYLNTDSKFNKIKGDYYSLKHPKNIEVNMIVNYSKKFMNIENSIVAQIWVITKNETELKNLKIKVYSEKNGILNFHSNFNRTRKNPYWVEKIFTKKLDTNTNFINLVSDDKIYVEVNGYKYTFVTPKVN